MPQEKIFDLEFAEQASAVEAYADFVAIVRQLRRDCPWDREQTHESVRHLLIEEAYETVEAIEKEDYDELKRELGDVLLHVVFHSVMAEEKGRFTMNDVITHETEKLVRRHPHVFGDDRVEDTGEVLRNWEQIKMQERERKSALEGVPGTLPSLLRAFRVQEKAAGVGFDFPERDDTWEKVHEEIEEFRKLVEGGAPTSESEKEFGDLIFALVNYARFTGINPENALRHTNDKFVRRFQYVESRLRERGETPADSTLDAMDELWNEAKAQED